MPHSHLRRTQIPPVDGGFSVGNAIAHDSAAGQIQGTAQYIDDMPEAADILHIAPGYATGAAKGKITSLDLDAVRAAPGVVAVLTAADIPGKNDCSPSFGGDSILADGRIEFHGQVIFAVAARTREQARQAARLAKIEIDAEQPAVTVEDGLTSGETVLPDYQFLRGDPIQGMNGAAHTASGSIHAGGQEHFYLEGQVAMALPGEGGEIHVYSSTQHPSEVQHLVAHMLAKPLSEVVCECRRMGGGFGGKESQASQWGCIAALVASTTGSAAKVRLDRDDDMIMTGKRHDVRADYSYAHDDKGRLLAVDVEFNARCGYSADLSLGVCDRTMFHADNAYYYPNVRIRSRRVKTDTVSNTAFRGFGGPQGMVFAERMMDEIAIRLGIDPLIARKRNFYGTGRDRTPFGMKVADNIAPRLIRELELTSDYQQRRKAIKAFNRKNRFLKKGIALTPVKFGIAFTLKHLNQAGALVHVYTDGSVQVNHGGTEMGQGLYTKVAQVVAEEFGIAFDSVKITATKTDKVPNTTPTAASSGSDLNGMAAKRAAETIKDRMAELAGRLYQAKKSEIRFANNLVQLGRTGDLLCRAGEYLFPGAGLALIHRFFRHAESHLEPGHGKRSIVPLFRLWWRLFGGHHRHAHRRNADRSGRRAARCRQVAQPGDRYRTDRGRFRARHGWLTAEELVYDAAGRLTTHAPSTYKIPTAGDVPEDFRVALWDSKGNKERTIYRSKAVGEPPLMLAISVFSAITHAVASLRPGRVPRLDTPATPEAIARAVRSMLDE